MSCADAEITETRAHEQHSAPKPSAAMDSSVWTAGNGLASNSSATASERSPAGQYLPHSESTELPLHLLLRCLTVEQLLVCGLLSLRHQKAIALPQHSQPAFDLRYLPQWQTAVDHFASKQLAEAESAAAPAPGPSAPEASGVSQEFLSRKRQKLHHGAVQIPLLKAADATACKHFAASIQDAMAAVRRSGGQMYTSSSKIYCILHRCSRCDRCVAVGITGTYSSPANGSCSRDTTDRRNPASKQLDIRCWACLG